MLRALIWGIGVAGALMVVFGSASAGAVNELVGMTYESASSKISDSGRTAVIRTRSGGQLPTEQCIVTASRAVKGGKTYVDLNCNNQIAVDGQQGNSAASPEGKKAMLTRERAERLSANYEQSLESGKTPSCLADESSTNWCVGVCKESQACSAELNDALGLSS